MAISLAGIELPTVAMVRAAEERNVVHHHLPGFDGDVLQDLGRGPSIFIIDGVLHGAQADADADALRAAFRGGEPVEFIAALASTLQVEEVVIRSLELVERAGWADLFDIRAVIVEYVEPPAAATVAVGLFGDIANLALDGLADAWSAEIGVGLSVESLARQIINDPTAVNDLLAEASSHPENLFGAVTADVGNRLAGDVGGLSDFMGSVAGDAAPGLFGAIGGALTGQPGALQGALTSVSGAALGPVFSQMASGDIVGGLLSAASDLTGGQLGEILSTLASNPEQLGEMVGKLKDDPLGAAALAAGTLADLGVLPDVLSVAPELLGNLDPNDIAGSLVANLESLAGESVKDILTSVVGLDPEKAGALIDALADADSLQDVANILADTGMEFLEDATGLDLRQAFDAVEGLFQGGDFIQKARAVMTSMQDVVTALENFNPLADLEQLLSQKP